jgi:hypothetical protein
MKAGNNINLLCSTGRWRSHFSPAKPASDSPLHSANDVAPVMVVEVVASQLTQAAPLTPME